MAIKKEKRRFRIEVRAAEDGTPRLVGYAARFNVWSQDLGGFQEIIRPGFFRAALETSDVVALWNHNDDLVLGRARSGTLTVAEDDEGLAMEIIPPDTQWGRDAVTSIRRGDVDQMSFAFAVDTDRWYQESDGVVRRELITAREIFDVSPVTYPAYKDTSISVRQLVEGRDLSAEERNALRDILGTAAEDEVPPPAGPSLAMMRRRLDVADKWFGHAERI